MNYYNKEHYLEVLSTEKGKKIYNLICNEDTTNKNLGYQLAKSSLSWRDFEVLLINSIHRGFIYRILSLNFETYHFTLSPFFILYQLNEYDIKDGIFADNKRAPKDFNCLDRVYDTIDIDKFKEYINDFSYKYFYKLNRENKITVVYDSNNVPHICLSFELYNTKIGDYPNTHRYKNLYLDISIFFELYANYMGTVVDLVLYQTGAYLEYDVINDWDYMRPIKSMAYNPNLSTLLYYNKYN